MNNWNGQSEERGNLPKLDDRIALADIVPVSVTIRPQWLKDGTLFLPEDIAKYMKRTNTVHFIYEGLDELLPYEEDQQMVEGLNDFYNFHQIRPGSKIVLQLRTIEPTRILLTNPPRPSPQANPVDSYF